MDDDSEIMILLLFILYLYWSPYLAHGTPLYEVYIRQLLAARKRFKASETLLWQYYTGTKTRRHAILHTDAQRISDEMWILILYHHYKQSQEETIDIKKPLAKQELSLQILIQYL